jgi:hypothetical protein
VKVFRKNAQENTKENVGNFSLIKEVILAARREMVDINGTNLPATALIDFLCLAQQFRDTFQRVCSTDRTYQRKIAT